MSAGMLEGIDRFCPFLSNRFREGCMSGVTRTELVEYAAQCPTLSLDWGPFFDVDDNDGEIAREGDWQRGRPQIGKRFPDDGPSSEYEDESDARRRATELTMDELQARKREQWRRKKAAKRRRTKAGRY
jgi:hypothetical protein